MAYKYYFFFNRGEYMKEIGEKLKAARESIGISIDEASEDLKISSKQISDIEEGNVESFQDVFNLKYFIRDYAKYLGLDKEQIVDDFNEYLFDYTSKLSLDDIKKEAKSKKDDTKIKSPYTIERKREKIYQNFIYIAIFVLLITIVVLLYTILNDNNEENVLGGWNYEFTEQNNFN